MNVGLLWFDGSTGRDLAEKVARAAQRYEKRFGDLPNTCYVNTTHLPDGEIHVDGVTVKPATNQLPGHFWIGRETSRSRAEEQLQLFSGGRS